MRIESVVDLAIQDEMEMKKGKRQLSRFKYCFNWPIANSSSTEVPWDALANNCMVSFTKLEFYQLINNPVIIMLG